MIDPADIDGMTDAQIHELFCALRWQHNAGHPLCPHCAHPDIYLIRRQALKCKRCKRQFTVTSGTILQGRKLPLRAYLKAIAIFVGARDGISSHELARRLHIGQKAAWVLAHKLREAMDARLDQIDVKAPVHASRSERRFRAITAQHVESYVSEVLYRAGHRDDPDALLVADLLEMVLRLPPQSASEAKTLPPLTGGAAPCPEGLLVGHG